MVDQMQANPGRPIRQLLSRTDAILAVLALVIVLALGVALNLMQPVTTVTSVQQSLATAHPAQGEGQGQPALEPTVSDEYGQ
jgi:preprotein translocase subunit SecG